MERPYTFKDFLLRPRRLVSAGCDVQRGAFKPISSLCSLDTTTLFCKFVFAKFAYVNQGCNWFNVSGEFM